jgi:predicted GH43/DUF377 family glycosyl hydrolase
MKRKTKSPKMLAEEISRATSNINVLCGVIAVLEGGALYSDSYGAADRIIAICKAESERCLKRRDKAEAQFVALTSETANDTPA